jgi:hypothetical protein
MPCDAQFRVQGQQQADIKGSLSLTMASLCCSMLLATGDFAMGIGNIAPLGTELLNVK